MSALYRVRHVSKRDGNSYENTIVAVSPEDAADSRSDILGIDPADYEVTVEPVPDPDGTRAAFWLRHFGAEAAR